MWIQIKGVKENNALNVVNLHDIVKKSRTENI